MTGPLEDSFDTDILIVGGGPIGLVTACALAHHGLNYRIVEQRSKPKPHSRANNLWARPQELLHSIGLRDALAEKAYRITEIRTLINGQPVDPVAISDVESPFGPVLYSGQDVIEKTLSDQIEARGGHVERGRRLIGLTQDQDGVTATLGPSKAEDESEDGGAVAADAPTETVRCRYLIGADGGESLVRQLLGLEFEPEKLPDCMNRQVDAKLSWRRGTDFETLWFFYYPKGFCGVLPVWGGYHRLFFLADDTGIPDRDPTLEEIQAIAREVTEDETLTLSDPIWLTHSRFQHGVAAHYAKDRVFLVGDAGHRTLPIGGQGMNAGLHDAVGLAWRLAMVLRGEAGDALLNSYDAERGGEHHALDERQRKGFGNSVYRGHMKDAAIGIAAKLLPSIGTLLQGSDDLQQLSVAYPDSPLSVDHLKTFTELLPGRSPHAGDRAPDSKVVDANGCPTTLFAQIYNPDDMSCGWSLLAFDGRQVDARPMLEACLETVADRAWVRPRLVLGAASFPPRAAVVYLFDLDALAHAAYGITNRPSLILIRPDGHIAFRGRADRPELLREYCEGIEGLTANASSQLSLPGPPQA
ncbi:2-polyprenyl-6-methoxyphenol hydroxylase-like FAD-dependent oxidoreductase [Rhizobium sp. PP-CC-3A-592]|nr:2-polyprenyl-6-methoxyphenol hydroxylase-like FAD-dependent oxidoreductase [Rhizobium sp. PP-CC-3A-592]